MKNLTRKLFLSICTLAICAVTLVSTTFAWYTTNTEVKASNIVGASAADGDASIFIATAEDGPWMQEVKIGEKAISMKPLMLNGTDLVDLAHTTENPSVGNSTEYIEFTLWFKTALTDKAVNIKLSDISIRNQSDNLEAYDNLLNGNTESNLGISSSASVYKKDIANALAMTIASTTATLTSDVAYSLDSFNENGKNLEIAEANANDAHAYYNKVMGSDKQITGAAVQEYTPYNTSIIIAIIPANTTEAVSVTFRIFLAGNDKDCFDAVKGQRFTVNFTFNSETQK